MEKKESAKAKIIRVATRMFLENGYSATTVQSANAFLKSSGNMLNR